MSDFFKKFLVEDARRFGSGGRSAALAAFGKHPGWDDHVEDLGLETESLNLAKTVLYVNGIGGQIDSGAWEKLDPAQQLPVFKHVFVWQRGGQMLIGRLWSSSDGKGRKRYPMVVCAHFMGVTLDWALKQALPILAELEERCLQTNSAEEVRALLGRKRFALREAIQSAAPGGEYAPVSPDAMHRIIPSSGDAAEGFLRVLYQMQSQLGSFSPGRFNARANPATMRAQQIRVPIGSENAAEALLFWSRLLLSQVDAAVPLLLTLPLEEHWLDVTIGEPESHEFFCLRASPKSVPLVSEVPYKLDDAFRAKAATFLKDFQRGETPSMDLQASAAPAAPAPAKSGWFKWFALAVLLVVGGVAAVMMLPESSGTKPEAKSTPTNAGVAKVEPVPPPSPSSNPAVVPSVAAPPKESPADIAARQKAEAEAKQKSEAESAAQIAAQKELLRQREETARIEREKQAALIREREEQQRKADEEAAAKRKADEEAAAKRKADEEAAAKRKADEEAAARVAATAIPTNSVAIKPAATNPPTTPTPVAAAATPTRGEMTNGIGMILVPLPSGIWAGKYEVTQAEYRKVMASNPSRSKNDPQPVESVTWNEAREFCRRLTELEKNRLPLGRVYTLPTEAQWKEYAAGQTFANLPAGIMSRTGPAPVGLAGPNQFGMFDVLGNVWEWCLDDATSGQKLLKGGAFRSAYDNKTLLPDQAASNCGFRCVIAAP